MNKTTTVITTHTVTQLAQFNTAMQMLRYLTKYRSSYKYTMHKVDTRQHLLNDIHGQLF